MQPEGVADTGKQRNSDDGILLIVEGRVFGKTARMLIDSGASRCFVIPGAVFRLGLHSVAEPCMLELADGRKIMTNGKVPAALVQIASSSARVDMTVSPLLHAVDVILGVTWLSSVNPLIDWTVPRLIFPDSVGTTTTRGTFLTKEHHVGTVSVISHSCFSSAPPSRLLPPQLALLRTPSFWRHASSSNAWSRSSSAGGVTCAALRDSGQVEQPAASKLTSVTTMTKVQGRRCVKRQGKASLQRQLLSAKSFEKLAKRGEEVYLAVVRQTSRGQQTETRED